MYVNGNQYALCVPAIVVIIRRFNVLTCQPVFDVKKASEKRSATMCSEKILYMRRMIVSSTAAKLMICVFIRT